MEMSPELFSGLQFDGGVLVAPYKKGGDLAEKGELGFQLLYIVRPGLKAAQKVRNGAGNAQRLAVAFRGSGRHLLAVAIHATDRVPLKRDRHPRGDFHEELSDRATHEPDSALIFLRIGIDGSNQHHATEA